LLQNNGIDEVKIWPVTPESGAISQYVAAVAKNLVPHARDVLLQGGLSNLSSSA
jgi:hypothetical protein